MTPNDDGSGRATNGGATNGGAANGGATNGGSGAVLGRLLDLAAERFGRPRAELAADVDFYDALGIDSMEALSLLSALEQRFGVEVPDYEVQDARTFADLAQAIQRRL